MVTKIVQKLNYLQCFLEKKLLTTTNSKSLRCHHNFQVLSVPKLLRTHKNGHFGLNSGGLKLRLSLGLRQSPPHLLLPLQTPTGLGRNCSLAIIQLGDFEKSGLFFLWAGSNGSVAITPCPFILAEILHLVLHFETLKL